MPAAVRNEVIGAQFCQFFPVQRNGIGGFAEWPGQEQILTAQDQRDPVLVGDFGERVEVGNVAVRVAERLGVDRPGVGRDRRFNLVKVVNVDEGRFDPVVQQVVNKIWSDKKTNG